MRKGKVSDRLSLLIYVYRVEDSICPQVYPLLNTRIPNKFLAGLRIQRSPGIASIPPRPLWWPEKHCAGRTDRLPSFDIDPDLTAAVPNEALAGLGIVGSFRVPRILSRPLRQFEARDRG